MTQYRPIILLLSITCLLCARAGHAETCEGDKLTIPDSKSIALVKVLADTGDAHAQAQMGAAYLKGKEIQHDRLTALTWLEKSAEGGSSEGQYVLAVNLIDDRFSNKGDTDSNFQKAASWFKKSADQGCIPAVFYLGLLTQHGNGVPKNIESGNGMIIKAAEAGYYLAELWLGSMMISGDYVNKDTNAGFAWVKRAADTKDSMAEITLATLYLEGKGTEINPEKTRNLLESVYVKKDEQAPVAAYYLGWMYMEGKGVPVDTVKAFTWMIIAANSNVSDSAERLKTLTEKLPKQKLSKSCDAYMDPLFETDGAKEYAHLKDGEIVAVLKARKTSYMAYFPDRRFVGFILGQCLN